MSELSKATRRGFVKLCAVLAGTGTLKPAGASALRQNEAKTSQRSYHRVQLVTGESKPLKSRDLRVGESYLFHYPYVATPCFLLNLGEANAPPSDLATAQEESYQWQPGVGASDSIVAFSAVCAHKMSHPARSISFINYRHEAVKFWNHKSRMEERGKVIFCCSEKSVYDPVAGGRVIAGPAPQPLAGITLEHDQSDDTLYATGTFGGEMFHRFFDKFGHRLQIEYGLPEIRAQVTQESQVIPITEFCAKQVLCGATRRA